MKRLSCTLLSILLPLSFCHVFAQPPASKPVLSAAPETDTPPPPPAIPAPPPGTVSVDPTYVIGADDSIEVTTWHEPSLSAKLVVRPDGMITLPLIGDVPAAGRTPLQLAADLTAQLRKFLKDEPTVTITVLGVNSKRIYFFGEVVRPGPMNLTPGMTIMQAIATAGGLSPFANKKKIYILRGIPGKQQKILFDYRKAIKSGDMQGITLLPGDTIVVPS